MNQTIRQLHLNDKDIILLGTAHISKESITDVEQCIHSEMPDCVCVELDEQRYKALTDTKQWQELDIVSVIKSGKGFLLLANLVLASFQKRIGSDVGVKPGDEMKTAITAAHALSIKTELVDRPIHITLKRAWAKNNFWGKSKLLATLLSSAFSTEKLSAEEIEALKNKSEMDSMMAEMAEYLPQVKEALIDERDRYLATKIWHAEGKKIVAVLGAGHLAGTASFLEKLQNGTVPNDLADIADVPPKGLLAKLSGWALPALIVLLIALGCVKGGLAASGVLLVRWLLWNGSLAALGTLCALGHPLTIAAGFLGAPIATLTPVLGVGMFTGIMQAWVRKPQVCDMENLSTDIMNVKGWYKNKIAHVLLIFFLSSLGGAVGNFIAVPALVRSLV